MIVGEVVESETFTKVHDTLLIQSNFLLHGCLCFQFLHQTFACKQKTMLMGYLHFVIVILELTFPALIEQVYWLRPLPYSIGWAVCPEEQPARLEKLKKHYFGSYYNNNSTLTKDLSNVTFCLWWKQHLIKILYESFSCLQTQRYSHANYRITNIWSLQHKQEVQRLQAFAFSVVTVNDEHKKPGFKMKCRG